jgi:hypothetical protein
MSRRVPIAVLLLSAGSCDNTTGGALIHLPMSVGGTGTRTFVTPQPLGWTVTLNRARIALGPYYFNVSREPSTTTVQTGVVIIQATVQSIVDPLDLTLQPVVGGADGETGTAFTVEIGLLPPDATESPGDLALLNGSQAYVEGTAVKGATTIPFAGFVRIDASLATPQIPLQALQRVNGASVDLNFSSSEQQLTMRVDPTHWFDRTDFSVLLGSSPDGGTYSWDTTSTFHSQLLQGLQSTTDVYLFEVSPQM